MINKICFKCGISKPLSEFYKHPQMKDGHLNKCKSCTKQDTKQDYNRKSQDEDWMEKERARGREKYHKLGYRTNTFKKVRSICPNNANLTRKLKQLGLFEKDKEAHHWNYNQPNSVMLISRRAHHRIHSMITVNYEDKYCYTQEGVRIETEAQAIQVFREILAVCGIYEPLEITNI